MGHNKKKVKGNSVDVKNINIQLEQAKASIGRLFLILGAQYEIVTPMMLMEAFRAPKKPTSGIVAVQESHANFQQLKENIDIVAKKSFSYFAELKISEFLKGLDFLEKKAVLEYLTRYFQDHETFNRNEQVQIPNNHESFMQEAIALLNLGKGYTIYL